MMKLSMLFQYNSRNGRAGGWSESWYFDGTLASARTALEQPMRQRANLLGAGINIIGQRYTQLFSAQSNRGKSVSEADIVSAQEGLARDIPQMAILASVRGEGTPQVKRYFLRGLPDEWADRGDIENNNDIMPRFNAWATSLRTASFRFRANDLTQGAVGINTVSALGVFSLAAPLVYNSGDYFTLLRCRDQYGRAVTGTFQVVRTSDVSGTFVNWDSSFLVIGSGAVRKVAYMYPLLEAASHRALRVDVRKVGRPFVVYHGRRR